MTLSADELARYARHIVLHEIGGPGQQRLHAARVLVVGAGGILTELLKDAVTLILPTSRPEIERALKTLKVWKLVEGFRGKSGDQAAVIAAIEAVAAFAAAHRGLIEELDVNPLLVLPDGAIAVDALIKMRNA